MAKISFEDKYKKSKIHNLGQALAKLRAIHEEAKVKNAEVWAEVDYLRLNKIPEVMAEMEITSVKIKGVGTLGTRFESSCSTQDKDALIAWLKENHFESLISTETVNSGTLKAFINEQLRNGDVVPPAEIVKFTPFEMAVITK